MVTTLENSDNVKTLAPTAAVDVVQALAPTPSLVLPKKQIGLFSSLPLFFTLISLTAITILVGSWCPQEAAVGRDKVFEQFGPEWGQRMLDWGIADMFHTPFFLGLIGLLTVNLVCASFTRVFPKLKQYFAPMPMLSAEAIEKMPTHQSVTIGADAIESVGASVCTTDTAAAATVSESAASGATAFSAFAKRLRRSGYIVTVEGNRLTAHWGRIGRTAATITHIGLLSLLTGVTITSWTGFAGFEPILLHESLNFKEAKHSTSWVGKMPTWHARVDATRREDYESGDPKQWYSTLTVVDNKTGKELKKQEISVNNPLSYDGVDIYQSSWGLHGITLSFNGHPQMMRLNDMGRVHAAMLPLDRNTIMIFSIRDAKQPVRVFAKIPEWQAPRFLTLLPQGKAVRMGSIEVKYIELVPATGLQYKKDPGLPITYLAFGFIITGVLMASIPFRQVWAAVQQTEEGEIKLVFGGNSRKAKNAFARSLERMKEKMEGELVACRNSK